MLYNDPLAVCFGGVKDVKTWWEHTKIHVIVITGWL